MMLVPDWAGYCRFRPAFADVMDERYHTLEWLDGEVLTGRVQFWRTDNAAIIAELRDYPTGAKDVHGLVAAGDLAAIIETLIPLAEQWGRDNGCIGAVIESRSGWGKALSGYGYLPFQLALRKEIG